MSTLIHRRVQEARVGANPKVIAQVRSGWIVIGDLQFLPGYCLLLADPVVPTLNALTGESRLQFLADMAALGDALLATTEAERINYEILGNAEAALHAHVFPRYREEPERYRNQPVWMYEREYRYSIPFDGERDGPLMRKIAEYLKAAGVSA